MKIIIQCDPDTGKMEQVDEYRGGSVCITHSLGSLSKMLRDQGYGSLNSDEVITGITIRDNAIQLHLQRETS